MIFRSASEDRVRKTVEEAHSGTQQDRRQGSSWLLGDETGRFRSSFGLLQDLCLGMWHGSCVRQHVPRYNTYSTQRSCDGEPLSPIFAFGALQ
jgi:hypothetical protein